MSRPMRLTPFLVAAALVAAAALAFLILSPPSHATVGGMAVGPQRCTGTDSDPDALEECARLTTFARQLLDQTAHGPVTSVAVYQEPPSNIVQTYGGNHDAAIVSFKIAGNENAFYVNCGAGISKTLCFDPRPLKPGDTTYVPASHPEPYEVP